MNIVTLPRLSISPLQPDELDVACDFLHQNHRLFYSRHLPDHLVARNTRGRFIRHVRLHSSGTWLARLGGKVVGAATVTANCIDDLWVDENIRRRGIGARLVAVALEHIAGKGFLSAQAGVEDFNHAARSFYDSLGWRVIGSDFVSLGQGWRVEALVYATKVSTTSPGLQ